MKALPISLAGLLLSAAAPAFAVTFGQPDGKSAVKDVTCGERVDRLDLWRRDMTG